VTEGARIGVYRDALDFHRKRTTLLAADFYDRALDAARPRAMTVTGLHKLHSLLAVTRVIDDGIANNRTTSDIADEISAIVDKHGGTILPGSRIELIVYNALYTANAAGEWKAAMEFVEDRPYFKYVGPRDERNSEVCRRVLGIIVHYTDPILKHFWPPNHHWERQQWVTLGAWEVDASQVYRSPEGYEYPVIDGQVVRPADGWDFSAADAMGADDKVFIESARSLGAPLARKTPRDYGLAPIFDADPDALMPMPQLGNAVPTAAIERGWDTFQRTIGIENGSGTWVLDYAGDGVRINRDSFEIALTDADGNYAGQSGRYLPLILPTLRDPFEVWFVPFETEHGATLVKRYIGAFATPRGGVQTIALDRTDNGWLWRTIAPRDVEPLREGVLIRSRAATGGR
jgi:hypothetical protein